MDAPLIGLVPYRSKKIVDYSLYIYMYILREREKERERKREKERERESRRELYIRLALFTKECLSEIERK